MPDQRDNFFARLKEFIGPPRGDWERGHINQYSLIDLLGEGGMGAVILAVDEGKNRLVALKCLLPRDLADHSKVERFNREIESLENVQSDWAVQLLDHGEH